MTKRAARLPFSEEPPATQVNAVAPEHALVSVSGNPPPDKTESATEHSMRWEDDGGPAGDVDDSGSAGAA